MATKQQRELDSPSRYSKESSLHRISSSASLPGAAFSSCSSNMKQSTSSRFGKAEAEKWCSTSCKVSKFERPSSRPSGFQLQPLSRRHSTGDAAPCAPSPKPRSRTSSASTSECDAEAKSRLTKASKLEQAYNRPSNLKLRSLLLHSTDCVSFSGSPALAFRKSSKVQYADQRECASPAAVAKVDSTDTGMVRLVYRKARDIRQRRGSVSHTASCPTLKQLGSDFGHAVRVCAKARDFLDMAMDGVCKSFRESDDDSDITTPSTTTPTSPRQSLNVSDAAWAQLLDGLDSSPKTAHLEDCGGLSFSPRNVSDDASVLL